jgi:hypothetical protein
VIGRKSLCPAHPRVAFFQNVGAKHLLFDKLERLRDRKRICLGKFLRIAVFTSSHSVDRFCPRTFAFSAQRLFESIAGNWRAISTTLIHVEQLNVTLWFTHSRPGLSGLNHFTRMPGANSALL